MALGLQIVGDSFIASAMALCRLMSSVSVAVLFVILSVRMFDSVLIFNFFEPISEHNRLLMLTWCK